jgi:hypothetical protein
MKQRLNWISERQQYLPLLLLLIALLSGCDFRAQKPKCDDYFSINDRAGYSTDERGLAKRIDSDILWYRCPAGQTFSSRRCRGSILKLDWDDAVDYAKEYAAKSGKNWRLPTNDEMESIQEKQCVSPSVNPQVFPNVEVDNYWTSSDSWHHDSLRCSVYLFEGKLFCRQARTVELPFFLVLGEKR